MKIRTDINTEIILKKRGLGSSARARLHLANTVARLSDPFVPMQQGALKNTRQILGGGKAILYNTPHAHYQHEGKVMAGRAPKHYTGAAINYHGAPQRGKEWVKRMMANRGNDVADDLARYVGGKRK